MDSGKSVGTGWTCSNCLSYVAGDAGSHTCPTRISTTADYVQEKLNEFKDDQEFAFEAALLAFEEELAKRQIQMPPEFAELVEKHFWELV